MSDRDEISVPRRKALLTAASVGTAVAGLSTGALADDGSNGRGSALDQALLSPQPDPQLDAPDEYLDEDGKLDIPQEVLDDIETKVYDPETGEEVEGVKAQFVNPREVAPLRERRAEPAGGFSFGGELWDDTISGYDVGVRAEISASLTRGTASVDLVVMLPGINYELISLGISEGENGRQCADANPPSAIPASVSACPEFRWVDGRKEFSLGFTLDLCLGFDCRITTCEICRSPGIDRDNRPR